MISYSTSTDHELIALVKNGDQLAFTVIYDRYWRLIYAHILKMLRDEDEAKDVVEDIFSSIWINAASLPSQGSLGGFLYTMARNKVLNLLRHNKYKDDYLSSLAVFQVENTNATVDQLDERDLRAAIEREIEKLPPRMRAVFEMSRKQNMSNKEIAARLGTSDETVKKQIHNSLKAIRTGLDKSAGAGMVMLMLMR